MKKKIWFGLIFLVTVSFVSICFVLQGCSGNEQHQHAAKSEYYCPMHPQVISDHKGSCPICDMDLVKKDVESSASSLNEAKSQHKLLFYRNPMNPAITSPVPMKDSMGMDYVPVYEESQTVLAGVAINNSKQQLIGVKKDIVKKRCLTVEIFTVGKVAYDPDLYVAQEEYLQAVKTAAATQHSALVSIQEQSAQLLVSAERKLLLLGMSKSEVDALKNSGAAQENLYLPSHSGQTWVYIPVYEYEIGLIKEGQNVLIDAVAYPGDIFNGTITALTPILDSESRSVRVRVQVDDKDGKLKPEMFVNAKILIDLGEKLAIPQEAVMDSGMRKIVYVVLDNHFTPVEVTLGPKAGEFYEVRSGLTEGQEIVTSGNFLIDAESKLKGAL
ncbi:MAG: efflux RND transporter periplasmic adaptor subunit [Candidatus Omnitrophica bacterium]|nr:efflux RND transporter periplasmic adaptor subunit [Candidatus Omnitrophota bacterium]